MPNPFFEVWSEEKCAVRKTASLAFTGNMAVFLKSKLRMKCYVVFYCFGRVWYLEFLKYFLPTIPVKPQNLVPMPQTHKTRTQVSAKINWLIGGWIDWLIDWLTDWLIVWLFETKNKNSRNRLIRSPRYFEVRPNSLDLPLLFQLFTICYLKLGCKHVFRTPRYFELILVSLDPNST